MIPEQVSNFTLPKQQYWNTHSDSFCTTCVLKDTTSSLAYSCKLNAHLLRVVVFQERLKLEGGGESNLSGSLFLEWPLPSKSAILASLRLALPRTSAASSHWRRRVGYSLPVKVCRTLELVMRTTTFGSVNGTRQVSRDLELESTTVTWKQNFK